MLGIVLCGGESKRMGTDKGLISAGNQSLAWSQIAAEKLASLGIPVMISVNPQQLEFYSHLFSADRIIVDNPDLSIRGPLYGILSVHIQNPEENLLVLACDMPLMHIDCLQKLIRRFSEEPLTDAVLYQNEGEPEPLCAVYSSNALKQLLSLYQNGDLTRHSMKFALGQLTVRKMEITEDEKKFFQNFNAHASLNGL